MSYFCRTLRLQSPQTLDFTDFIYPKTSSWEENHAILLSSHITSDLEKIADYITFIHNGKLILTASKNDLAYNFAVMRCKESQFLAIDPKDILAYRKRDFQIDVLVSDGKEAQRKYKGVVIDHVSIDEIMLLSGIFVVAVISPSLLTGYALLGMIGFSSNAIIGLRKESSTKWSKYKLTAPVKRSDIVKSYFISQILWLIIGIAYAGIGVALSIMLHGVTLDRNADIFMLFVVGIGISLFMGAIFFPLFYLGGEERSEVFLIISLLCGIGIVMGLSTLINTFFPKMTTPQLIGGGMAVLVCSLLVYVLSYPLTVSIFKKKEY